MDMREIENTIEELENGPTTYDNCIKLSALYSVRDNIKSDTRKELDDVLPLFKMYVAVKTKYQLGELPATSLVMGMHDLCKEIHEFIDTLYNNTELSDERDAIREMLHDTLDAL